MSRPDPHVAHTLLIVDDDEALRLAMKIALTRDGHEVVSAATAPRAVDLLATDHFDLVICDVYMPGDGRSVLRHARAARTRTEIVMMTGRPSEALSADVREHGAELVAKPIDLDDFRLIIASHLASTELVGHPPDETA